MGFGPQVADLNADGHRDIISGSYPGELYLFAGQEDGSFAKATKLVDAEGEEINLGKAAAVFAADWDADGDTDLVVGDIRGHVWWMPNASGDQKLEFGEATKLEVGGEAIRVAHGDAGPVLADWDEDGTLDLIVGCGDGSVLFYANANSEGEPALAAPVALLPKAPGGMSLKAGDEARCGARAKPCVVDWDGDGRLDLLVGDVLIERAPPRELTDEERAEQESLQAKMAWVRERYSPALMQVRLRAMKQLGVEGEDLTGRDAYQRLSDEQKKKFSEILRAEMKEDLTAGALSRMLSKISRDMRKFRPPSTVHGHVWLLKREPTQG